MFSWRPLCSWRFIDFDWHPQTLLLASRSLLNRQAGADLIYRPFDVLQMRAEAENAEPYVQRSVQPRGADVNVASLHHAADEGPWSPRRLPRERNTTQESSGSGPTSIPAISCSRS